MLVYVRRRVGKSMIAGSGLTSSIRFFNSEQGKEDASNLLESQFKFKKYPSIQSPFKERFMGPVKQLGYDAPEILWTASEKIHGTNFSVTLNDKYVQYGRRHDFLTLPMPYLIKNIGEYIQTSNFYSLQHIISKLHPAMALTYERAKKYDPDLLHLTIYGQYFGGMWPNHGPHALPHQKLKAIQKGISYTPKQQFLAFDIAITTKERDYWMDVLQLQQILHEQGIRQLPIYAKGTLSQMLSLDLRINSTIPKVLKLPTLENNLIQGFVIRPDKSIFYQVKGKTKKLVFKVKNPQFMEQKQKEQKSQKVQKPKQKQVNPNIIQYTDTLLRYLTNNRIANVYGKIPQEKNHKIIAQAVIVDMLTDAQKDDFCFPTQPQLKKQIQHYIQLRTIQAINEYLKKSQ